MDLQVSKWGNSLALRLPASVVKQLGLCDGLKVHAQVTPDGTLAIQTADWRRSAFAAELEVARAALPMGKSVVDELRGAARY
jgi:antitoxin MazE